MNRHIRWEAGLLSALLLTGAAFAEMSHEADDEAMIDLAWDSGCFNCHDLDDTLRGPAWRDVAERYRDDDEALDSRIWALVPIGDPRGELPAHAIRDVFSACNVKRPAPLALLTRFATSRDSDLSCNHSPAREFAGQFLGHLARKERRLIEVDQRLI